MSQQRPGPEDWGGGFENVREMERRARQDHAEFCNKIRAAIALCDGILQAGNSSGFKAIEKTLEDMLEHRTNELFSAREDRQATLLQGRCQELKAILSIMKDAAGNREALAKALKEAEDRFHELERTFKPEAKPNEKNT